MGEVFWATWRTENGSVRAEDGVDPANAEVIIDTELSTRMMPMRKAVRLAASLRLVAMITLTALPGCSSSEAPGTVVSFAATYHLRSIDGVQLPISMSGGGFIDSGHVLRVGDDTVRIDRWSHVPPAGGFPGQQTIAFGTWLAAQSGTTVVLQPLLASTVDTLFIGRGDTLTRHTSLGLELYVAP